MPLRCFSYLYTFIYSSAGEDQNRCCSEVQQDLGHELNWRSHRKKKTKRGSIFWILWMCAWTHPFSRCSFSLPNMIYLYWGWKLPAPDRLPSASGNCKLSDSPWVQKSVRTGGRERWERRQRDGSSTGNGSWFYRRWLSFTIRVVLQ